MYDQRYFGRKRFRADTCRNGKPHENSGNRWKAADGAFRCAHCRQMVFPNATMGTVHRNHCPFCLHSLHVDTRPGNRASLCHARMEPVGLTRKLEGFDRYGRERHGDIMLVHVCTGCGSVNINRIAADDSCPEILDVFARSLSMHQDTVDAIEKAGIRRLRAEDADPLHEALFGKTMPA